MPIVARIASTSRRRSRFWHVLADRRQRVLDPPDGAALAEGKLVRLMWRWFEGETEMGAQLWLVLEDLARQLLGDGVQSGDRILRRVRS